MRRPVMTVLSICVAWSGVSLAMTQRLGARESAADFYKRYLLALQQAESFDSLLPFMTRPRVAEVKAEKPADRSGVLSLVKRMTPARIEVTKESVTAAGVTLTVTGMDARGAERYGTIP